MQRPKMLKLGSPRGHARETE